MLVIAGLAVCLAFGVCGGIISAFDGNDSTTPADTGTSHSGSPDPGGAGNATARMETVAPTEDPVEAEAEPEPEPTEEGPDVVYYANCAAVRAAGAAPIHRGEPGYSRKLDRDGDGTACE